TPLTDVRAFTIASTTSGRRPSLKLGTHSISRFIGTPHKFTAFKCRDTKVYRDEIGNLTVIRNVIDGKNRLFSAFDRTKSGLTAHSRRTVDSCRRDGLCRSHLHLGTCQREDELHVQRWRGARVEISGQRHRCSAFNELARGSVPRCSKSEKGCGQ